MGLKKKIIKKVKEKYFNAILDGRKRFEVRLADFECNPGDTLVLREQKGTTEDLSGRELNCDVLYKFNIKEIEQYYKKEDIEKHGLVILAVRKKYDL